MKTIRSIGVCVFAGIIATGVHGAQSGAPPPDFSPSSSVGWVAYGTDFIPPISGPRPVTFDPAFPYLPACVEFRVSQSEIKCHDKPPTFRIADLSNPILQPWAREELRKRNEQVLAGKPGYTRQTRCWPLGTPAFLLYPVNPVFIVQSPKEVVFITQADNQVRRVYLGVPHSRSPKPSWYGESIGHYEGDTLVVDTIGFNIKTTVPLTPNSFT